MIMLGGFDVFVCVVVGNKLEYGVSDKPDASIGGVGQLNPAHIGAIAIELREDIRVVQVIDWDLITS